MSPAAQARRARALARAQQRFGPVAAPAPDESARAAKGDSAVVPSEWQKAQDRLRGLAAELASATARADLLLDAARDLAVTADPGRIAQIAVDAVERSAEPVVCAFVKYDPAADSWIVGSVGGRAAEIWRPLTTYRSGDVGFSSDVLRGRVVCQQRIRGGTRSFEGTLLARGWSSYVVMPVNDERACRAAIASTWRDGHVPQPAELQALESISLLATVALRSVMLTRQLEESRASLVRAKDQISHASRLQALGQVASGVAHDFNNSLTTILGLSDWLLYELPRDTAFYADLETIRTAAQDAAAMVKRLQMFGRLKAEPSRQQPFETLDLTDVARAVADLARPRCQELAVQTGHAYGVVAEGSGGPLARGSAGEIRELLINLVFNGLDAMPRGGVVRITPRERASRPEIVVADSGVGMAEDVKARIFEPFFSTKGQRGNGLGLSVCASIAERHGAELAVDSEPGVGTAITLVFPVLPAASAEAPAAAPSQAAARWTLRVLVVDDEPDVCDSLGAMVSSLGHAVTKARDGATALDMVLDRRFDVVVTDLGMPGMNGLELARGVTACRPETAVVLITAWGSEFDAAVVPPGVAVVPKPVTMDGLRASLADACERRVADRSGLRLVHSSEARS